MHAWSYFDGQHTDILHDLMTLGYYVFMAMKTRIQSSQLHSIVLPGVTIILEELTASLLSMMEASGNHLPGYMMS